MNRTRTTSAALLGLVLAAPSGAVAAGPVDLAACRARVEGVAAALGLPAPPVPDGGVVLRTASGDVGIDCHDTVDVTPPDRPDRNAPPGYRALAVRAVARFTGAPPAAVRRAVAACVQALVPAPRLSKAGRVRAERQSTRAIGQASADGWSYACTVYNGDRRGAELSVARSAEQAQP